jgi:hypothetical protein
MKTSDDPKHFLCIWEYSSNIVTFRNKVPFINYDKVIHPYLT